MGLGAKRTRTFLSDILRCDEYMLMCDESHRTMIERNLCSIGAVSLLLQCLVVTLWEISIIAASVW